MTDKILKTFNMNLLVMILLDSMGDLNFHQLKKALYAVLERKVSKGSISGTVNRLLDKELVVTKIETIETKYGEDAVVIYQLTKEGGETVKKSKEYHQKIENNLLKEIGFPVFSTGDPAHIK